MSDALLNGLRRYIGAAFEHEDEFVERFIGKAGVELQECYMASERTKLVYMTTEDGGLWTDTISTHDFIAWAIGKQT